MADTPHDPPPAWLRPGLVELAELALGWLDALPHTPSGVADDDEPRPSRPLDTARHRAGAPPSLTLAWTPHAPSQLPSVTRGDTDA